MINYKLDIIGSFQDLITDGPDQEIIKEIVANFHYRDGKKHEDGSWGTIEITPKEFMDCLAYLLVD